MFVDAHPDPDYGAIVQRIIIGPVTQHIERPAHRFFGIFLHMAHIGPDHRQAEFFDHAGKLPRAFLIGGNLGLEVGDILRDIAGEPGTGGQ